MPIIRRLSKDQKERILERRERKNLLERRRKRLYNRKYRRGIVYLSSLCIRSLYALFFITALSVQEEDYSSGPELVTGTGRSSYLEYSRTGSYTVSKLVFSTPRRTYVYKRNDASLPQLEEGDTVIISRNILGRPVWFSKRDWSVDLPFNNGLTIHLALVILSLISFFFNDGLDIIGRRLIIAVAFLDLVLAFNYFFI